MPSLAYIWQVLLISLQLASSCYIADIIWGGLIEDIPEVNLQKQRGRRWVPVPLRSQWRAFCHPHEFRMQSGGVWSWSKGFTATSNFLLKNQYGFVSKASEVMAAAPVKLFEIPSVSRFPCAPIYCAEHVIILISLMLDLCLFKSMQKWKVFSLVLVWVVLLAQGVKLLPPKGWM